MRAGYTCIEVSGERAADIFRHEPGGHRWQRTPPTEKRGRVQTSTITVAVLVEEPDVKVTLSDRDLEFTVARGSGAGGQHRNVTDSAVQVKHIPTGIIVRCEAERSQHQNKERALSILRQRLHKLAQDKASSAINSNRRSQVGSGMRGDKTRTIRVRDDQVINHTNGSKTSFKRYSQGFLEDLN